MPRTSKRQQHIKALTSLALVEATYEEEFPSASLITLMVVLNHRYTAPRTLVPKIDMFSKILLLQQLDEGRVRQEIRMNMDSFFLLYDQIKDSRFYTSPFRKQTDVRVQMMVALERLGCYGNGASVGKLARVAGICGQYISYSNIFADNINIHAFICRRVCGKFHK